MEHNRPGGFNQNILAVPKWHKGYAKLAYDCSKNRAFYSAAYAKMAEAYAFQTAGSYAKMAQNLIYSHICAVYGGLFCFQMNENSYSLAVRVVRPLRQVKKPACTSACTLRISVLSGMLYRLATAWGN